MQLFGFDENYAPNTENADIIPLNDHLDEYFFAYASEEALTRNILNAWTKMPIINWAEKHPFTKGSSDQLAILFSPKGLYLAVPGYVNAEYLDELADFGAEIVLAQR